MQDLGRSCRRLHSTYTYLQCCQKHSVANGSIKLVEFLRVVQAADSSFSVMVVRKRQKCREDCKRDARSEQAFPNGMGSQTSLESKQVKHTSNKEVLEKGNIKYMKGKDSVSFCYILVTFVPLEKDNII